ncbi:hypothetical protein [Marinimicrobium sp. ARAG 43.8]|uniref:hypothetical protein n=1 Tax=Marinimicrobium sp. ARAG 43.8 TaxID=3418719 RepID=UPI003CF28CFD
MPSVLKRVRRTPLLGRALTLVLATLWLAGCTSPSSLPLADDHLRSAEPGNFDHVFVAEDKRLPQFSTVFIEPATVALSDYWLRERRTEYTQRDLDRIQEDYGRYLNEALSEGLSEETGLKIVEDRTSADMVFRPRLRNLNIYAPDLSVPGNNRYYTREVGNATFDLVIEEPNGKVLAQFIDHRETQGFAGQDLEWTTRATNYRQFSRLMERWTSNLSSYLLIANAVPPATE